MKPIDRRKANAAAHPNTLVLLRILALEQREVERGQVRPLGAVVERLRAKRYPGADRR